MREVLLCSVFLLQCYLCGAAEPICNATATKHAHPDFSLFVLAMQWPFSVCETLGKYAGFACQSPPAAFTVRGLWPTAATGGQSPECCASAKRTSQAFSLVPIIDLAPQLRHLWPDLSLASNASELWETQWLQHGTCSGLSLRSYFRKVLEISRRYEFLRALSAQGVVASMEKTHRYNTVQHAVNGATGGFHVRMRCKSVGDGAFLSALQVCLHKDRFFTIDCPDVCLDGEVDCCDPGERIRIPYWRHERNGHPAALGADRNATSTDTTSLLSGYWVGQIAGVMVFGAGLAFWLFKQFVEVRLSPTEPRPNRAGYQRIVS